MLDDCVVGIMVHDVKQTMLLADIIIKGLLNKMILNLLRYQVTQRYIYFSVCIGIGL